MKITDAGVNLEKVAGRMEAEGNPKFIKVLHELLMQLPEDGTIAKNIIKAQIFGLDIHLSQKMTDEIF